MHVKRPVERALGSLALMIPSSMRPLHDAGAQTPHCAAPVRASDGEFHEGQVWSYKHRAGESDSTITVLRVENVGKIGVVIHVRIDGIRFGNCTGDPAPTSIAHAPFAKAALAQSVTRLLRTLPTVPNYMNGYKDWAAHSGGAYTISVAEMVKLDDRTFNAGLGCPGPKLTGPREEREAAVGSLRYQ